MFIWKLYTIIGHQINIIFIYFAVHEYKVLLYYRVRLKKTVIADV